MAALGCHDLLRWASVVKGVGWRCSAVRTVRSRIKSHQPRTHG